MFTIIRWIFSIALLILVIYLLLLAYNAIKKEGIGNFLDPITTGISSLFSGIGMTTTATTTKNFFADFFTPRQVAAPLVVVPSPEWYESMDAFYKQIYFSNTNYPSQMAPNTYFNYDTFFIKHTAQTSVNGTTAATKNSSSTNLELLFPSPKTYMELRNYLKDASQTQ